ncbi:MAG: hypothetical protein HY677_03810, partial [Chloroflexi bacterium]|nr:hypothetical protein [Chloroflexota bacterium]
AEILDAVKRAPSEKVIILPNNENIVMTAREAAAASGKQAAVIPTRSIPQGISALIALKPDASLEGNASTMEAMAGTVQTGEITSAIRAGRSGEVAFEAGQSIGILDGELIAAADSHVDVFRHLLERMQAQEKSLLSIYWGTDASPTETERMLSYVKQRYPSLEVEVVEGGQPHYPYIISIE